MILLILGLLLWSAGHLWKRILPASRERLGDSGRGVAAAVIIAGIVLMWTGHGPSPAVWEPPEWLRHPSNALALVAVYLFAVSGLRTRLSRSIRHPMLWGVVLWGAAHLLFNGDTSDLVLFGGLVVWALAEMVVINRAEPSWSPSPAKPAASEGMAVLATLVVYVVIGLIHGWIGPRPLG